nr:Chain B, FxxFF motif peptide [synthetic construct]
SRFADFFRNEGLGSRSGSGK